MSTASLAPLSNPSLTSAKVRLGSAITTEIDRLRRPLPELAAVMGLHLSDVERIVAGRVLRFTLDRLLEAYQRLLPGSTVAVALDLHADQSILPQDQTSFAGPTTKGNCMQAAVATLLKLPLGAVENFVERGEYCHKALMDWCDARGFELIHYPANHVFDGYYLACGKTERGTSHMVVMRDGELAHDPHPSRAGLVSIDFVYLVVPHAPARIGG